MSLYSTYNTLTERCLSDTTETFYESATKAQAINDAIEELLESYDIPEFIKRSTITFDSDGLAAIPSDYFRMVKLWDVDSNGVETNEYKYIVEDKFDKKSSSDAHFWNEDYIVADAERKLKVLPTDSDELQIRYVKVHGEVDTTGATDSGLQSRWDKVVAYGAAKILLLDSGQYDEARIFEDEFMKRAAQVFGALKKRGGVKQANRIKSRWSRQSLLNR